MTASSPEPDAVLDPAWLLAEEFDQLARRPGARPDPDLLDGLVMFGTDEVVTALLEAHAALCAGEQLPEAETYAAHLTALADLLEPDGRRAILAAVDVAAAELYQRTGQPEEALRRAQRCAADVDELMPGLLGDREWVLACLADDAGNRSDAHHHAARARDVFAAAERWAEAAGAAEAAAATHERITENAVADWRRAAELQLAAGEPDEARACAEAAIVEITQAWGGFGPGDEVHVARTCTAASALAREHGLVAAAVRIDGLAAALLFDSATPFEEAAVRLDRCRADLETLDRSPDERRLDDARLDAYLGMACVAHSRWADAERLLVGALQVFRTAGLTDEATMCEDALRGLLLGPSNGVLGDGGTWSDEVRLFFDGLRLAQDGRTDDALACLARAQDAATAAGDPHFALIVEALAAVLHHDRGDCDAIRAAVARIEAHLDAAGDRIPRSQRIGLTMIAGPLRAEAARLDGRAEDRLAVLAAAEVDLVGLGAGQAAALLGVQRARVLLDAGRPREALDVGLPATLALDALRCTLPDAHRRSLWAGRAAEGFDTAVRAAAACQDITLLAELLEVARGNAVPLPRAHDDRTDAVSALSAALAPEPPGAAEEIRSGPAAVAGGEERTAMGLPAFLRTPWDTVALDSALEAARRYVDPVRAPVTVDWRVDEQEPGREGSTVTDPATRPEDSEDLQDPKDIDEDIDDAEAWRLGEEFDRAARDPDTPPDPTLLAAVADAASDEVLFGLLDELHRQCVGGEPSVAEHYADHLAALAPLLGPNGHRGVLAAVDVHTAALLARTDRPGEAHRRVARCRTDLTEVLPALLADREWVLALLAEGDDRPGDALAHGARARDLFAEYERFAEAAVAAEAVAATQPTVTADVFADWRRAVDLYAAAEEPDEARRCAEQAAALVGTRLLEPHALADRTLPPLCEQARELARAYGHAELAARLGLAVAEFAGDSDLPWAQVLDRYARARDDLAVLGLDPEVLRVDLARLDLSLGRSAVAHQRTDEAQGLISAAAATLRAAGEDDDARTAERMLTVLEAARTPATAASLLDASGADPALRAGLLVAEALRLALTGDPGDALARIEEAVALVPDAPPHQVLLTDAVTAVARRRTGDAGVVPSVLARVDDALAAPDGLPRSTRTMLEQIGTLLGTDPQQVTAAPPAPPPEIPDLDAELAAVRRLSADDPDRAPRAVALIAALVRHDPHGEPAKLRPLADLLEIADGAVPETPDWARSRTWARLLDLQRRVAENELTDPDEALALLGPLEADAAGDPALRPIVGATRAILRLLGGIRHDSPGNVAGAALAEVHAVLDGMAAEHPEQLAPLLGALDSLGAIAQGGDDGDHAAQLRAAHRALEQLPPGHLRDAIAEALAQMAGVRGIDTDGTAVRLDDEQFAALVADVDGGSVNPDPVMNQLSVGMRALRGGQETDPARVELGIAAFRRAVDAAHSGHPHRVQCRGMLALGLLRRHELTLDAGALREARDVLEDARTLAGGPAHPQWQMVNGMLAEVRRTLGDGPDAARSAVEGLRRHIWQVLAQPDLAGASAAVRRASTDAVDAAVICLQANDPAGAIGALDAGRGLALFAATEVRSVPERLDEAGEAELARRWRAAAAIAMATGDPEKLPSDLRRDVLTALSTHSATGSLLDPPPLSEIQYALRALDVDALVYLMPGFGIAASASGSSYFALPGLVTDHDTDVERYLATLARRDAAAVRGLTRDFGGPDLDLPDADPDGGGDTDATLTASLDAVCAWAWKAVMGPLIESYLARLPAPASDRPHRVVLVPMGDLARIPWQAARRPDGVHAVQLIAISQAASARMLCLSARRPAVPPSPVGLVVGDPDTTDADTGRPRADALRAARLEAYEVRQAFYPGARYVGRLPDGSTSRSGPGSARQVRGWLTASSPGAGALLHLACHGVLESRTGSAAGPSTSYLLLAGGERLTAEELIEHMAQAPQDRRVGLVVLAACRTGLSISGYDEAYSLGTAFLAGGAAAVLSTQWSVPDGATSVLMFMFHHFLRTGGMPVWAALRAAQNWMLDPRREVPAAMPRALRGQLDAADLTNVTAWAAFVHWGR